MIECVHIHRLVLAHFLIYKFNFNFHIYLMLVIFVKMLSMIPCSLYVDMFVKLEH